jgi:hypothetical protein
MTKIVELLREVLDDARRDLLSGYVDDDSTVAAMAVQAIRNALDRAALNLTRDGER